MRSILLSILFAVAGSSAGCLAQHSFTLDQGEKGAEVAAVQVMAPRLSLYGVGLKVQRLDSTALAPYRSLTLADALAEQTPVTIKNYGPGGLSTPGFRGTAATHTGLLWNGFLLNSLQNGLQDLHRLPLGMVDQVQVQYGAAGALYGSSFVGGSIQLSDSLTLGGPITGRVSQQVGSFGHSTSLGRVDLGGRNWGSSSRLVYTQATNDFPFTNPYLAASPRVRQSNSWVDQWVALQAIAWAPRPNQLLRAWAWKEHSRRAFPGPLSDPSPGQAQQVDDALRLAADYRLPLGRGQAALRAAYFQEVIAYTVAPSAPWDPGRIRSTIAEAELRRRFGRFSLHGGLNFTFATAQLDTSAQGKPAQARLAAFANAAYASANGQLRLDASLRQEWVAQAAHIPLMPSVTARWQPLQWLGLRLVGAGAYRLPTLNELYWPTGNPKLRPEQGGTAEGGLSLGWPQGGELALSAYRTELANWTLWTQGPLGPTPRNLWRVRAEGFEAQLTQRVVLNLLNAQLVAGYSFTQSRILQAADSFERGQALPLVPRHQAQATLRLGYRRSSLAYNHTYTGYRLESIGLTSQMEPYWLGNLTLGQSKVLRSGSQVEAQLRILNLWAEVYTNYPGYATPGRSFLFSVSYSIH